MNNTTTVEEFAETLDKKGESALINKLRSIPADQRCKMLGNARSAANDADTEEDREAYILLASIIVHTIVS